MYDYAVSPDGREVVYSAANEMDGLDLWLIPSTGGLPRRLLDCGADWCSEPSFAPDGLKIAYSRRLKAENPTANGPGPGRVWLMRLKDGETNPLYADAAIGGQDVSWSPDGDHLALYDPLSGDIRVHNLGGGLDLVLPVLLEKSGGWTNDGKKLVFADYAIGQARPVGALTQVDLETGQVSPAFPNLDFVDYSTPDFNPTGDWMAIGGQAEVEGSIHSIWVVSLDGSQKLHLTDNPQASQGAYHWDADGKRLIYQEYLLGNSERTPEVFIWDLQTRTAHLVAENAALPAWVR